MKHNKTIFLKILLSFQKKLCIIVQNYTTSDTMITIDNSLKKNNRV